MSALSDWNRFSNLPVERLRALRDRALARYVRDELWPFARGARRRLERAGLDPAGIRGLTNLAGVTPIAPAELARAQHEPDERADQELVPDPAELRRSAGFSRRLALRIGGPRVAKLLAHAYATLFELEGPDGMRLAWTPHDIEIAGESGARSLAILGLQRKRDRTLAIVDAVRDTASLALHHGAIQAGARVEFTGTDAAGSRAESVRPTALIGSLAALRDVLRTTTTGLEQLERCVIMGLDDCAAERAELRRAAGARSRTDVELGRLWAPAWARMAFAGPVGPEDETAVHVHPDLGAFELDGAANGPNLIYTAACGHGTAVLRLATGLCAASVEGAPPADAIGFPLLTFSSSASGR